MVNSEITCWSGGCDRPCIGDACQYHKRLLKICDECHEEVDVLYDTDDGQLCRACTEKYILETVKNSPMEDEILKALDIEEVE